ncbi:MAG TPA: NAD(P)-dependent oxidoreductase [Ramlibacter sp.]|uniref:NAD(P)-dependent oxidoreductase n=1 Tax=Ramlibacter sp. TaxID=1917967 RepID=UPI002D230E96|nr:NAD(P)-dependent oxidoreductase [Ramlibacter sp.]HZY18922.1 NAD(P)-dependent oxidoreductase [Ramlibacter sp.]
MGAGNMGGAMAVRLLGRGWAVRIRDIDVAKAQALRQHGAEVAPTPSVAAAGAAALVVCVVDAQQMDEVLFGPQGAAAQLAAGTPVLLCPTVAPQDIEHCAGLLAAGGCLPIDAPMSGGPARAQAGTMSLMVACGDAAFAAAADLLADLSSRLFRVGSRPGDGARTKLVNNLLAGINLVGAAEALAMAQRLGLDPARTLEVIEQSSGQSWIGSDRMRRAIAGDFAPRAHLCLLQKDTRLAVAAAAEAGFEGPLGPAARDAFQQAAEAGLADLDDGALLRLLAPGP